MLPTFSCLLFLSFSAMFLCISLAWSEFYIYSKIGDQSSGVSSEKWEEKWFSSPIVCGLFSSFDPSMLRGSDFFEGKWMVGLLVVVFLSWQVGMSQYGMSCVLSKVVKFVFGASKQSLSYPQESKWLLLSVFYLVFLSSSLGLIPYLFTLPSHFTFNLSLAIPLWLSGVVVGLTFSIRSFFGHLVPVGAPILLWAFLVVVETISQVIRPLTLSIRLMANMMAGHLIMGLIGESLTPLSPLISLSPMILQAMLIGYELGVSLIQSFVFFNLLSLYWGEVEYGEMLN